MKAKYIILIIGVGLIFITPLFIYLVHFGSTVLSRDLNVWNMFGQYLGGTLGPLISVLTLGITTLIALEFNSYQKKQTTIQMFKEFRSAELLLARNNAAVVKSHWNDSSKKDYQKKFVEAMITEIPIQADEIDITSRQLQAVWDIFFFYSMLTNYKGQEETLKKLNYFFYAWWRKFLYEVAEQYDSQRIGDLNISALTNVSGFDYKSFTQDILLKTKLGAIDKICGFEKLFFENNQPINIYTKN